MNTLYQWIVSPQGNDSLMMNSSPFIPSKSLPGRLGIPRVLFAFKLPMCGADMDGFQEGAVDGSIS